MDLTSLSHPIDAGQAAHSYSPLTLPAGSAVGSSDIDSLHLFAQVVSSICRTLDEREILRNAFELISAFDEVVNLGYRENLTLNQIKTFLEMESHEERVAMIIESVRLAPTCGQPPRPAANFYRFRTSKWRLPMISYQP